MRRLQVSSRAAQRAAAGHPWIYANEIRAPLGDLVPGELVAIQGKAGSPIGIGYANPHSLIAVRILAGEGETIDADFFAKKLASAEALRRRMRPGAKAYRLCYGEGDNLPGLVVDRYDDVYVVASHTAGIDALLSHVVAALVRGFAPRGILVKSDSSDRKLEGLEPRIEVVHGEVPAELEVDIEGGRFVLDLAHGQKTGFFFDQADNRSWLAAHAAGARVLDEFSYVGAWGIRAALSGAKRVVCVDGSADAVRLGERSAAASGVGDRVRFERADAFDDLASRVEREERFDIVVLDPPAFVKSRRKLDEGMRGYRSINRLGMALVAPGGLLATSSCSRHVDPAAFVGMLQAAADDAKREARILAIGRQAPDHPVPLKLPEAGYLDCVFLELGPCNK
jgi:23S rRNA (cytosine1962-C5)-methyltransferase